MEQYQHTDDVFHLMVASSFWLTHFSGPPFY
jgi:hypothetical protein